MLSFFRITRALGLAGMVKQLRLAKFSQGLSPPCKISWGGGESSPSAPILYGYGSRNSKDNRSQPETRIPHTVSHCHRATEAAIATGCWS